MATQLTETAKGIINTTNDFGVRVGTNLPNHTMTKQGRGTFVSTKGPGTPLFRDKQQAYRYAAWLITMAQVLPDEEGQEGVTFQQVLEALQSS